jgi:hypothetical protein
MHKNSGGFLKIRRIYKILALFQKSGGFPKSWLFYKNQADFQNLCAFLKIRPISKILALFQKSGGFPKFRCLQKIRRPYCLGSAESPAADFLLVWLKSSRSDPRRCDVSLMQSPSERWSACTFICALSPVLYRLLVPARHARIHAEIQKLGGNQKF